MTPSTHQREGGSAREAVSDLGHAVWDRGCQSCAFASNALTEAADAMDDPLTALSEASAREGVLEAGLRKIQERGDEYVSNRNDYDDGFQAGMESQAWVAEETLTARTALSRTTPIEEA